MSWILAALALLNPAASASPFLVNGSTIPNVTFDIGSTYAGMLPISSDQSRKYFFWYMPAKKPSSKLTIWLNGGPGCSSLEGAIQENGPFHWEKGTYRPVLNEYSWTNLTDMLYIEQPIGTGFSVGTPEARDQSDISRDMLGFLDNFYAAFEGTKEKSLFLTGESYAGKYIPYIADAMYAKDYRLQGMLLVDPSITDMIVQQHIPANAFLHRNKAILGLSKTVISKLDAQSAECGYTAYMKHLAFPAKSLPELPVLKEGCKTWNNLAEEASKINPNFNIYHASDTRTDYDVLGFPNSEPYLPEGTQTYFAREDVQKALHAPKVDWTTCSKQRVFPHGDSSPDVVHEVLPRVISRNERTIITHGALDYVLIEEGTQLALQNMTWNGVKGFQQPPNNSFTNSQGETGLFVEERGLTYIQLSLSGHMMPEDQPESAYKIMQYLLGDIPTLAS